MGGGGGGGGGGGAREANSQQAHDVMCPLGFLINQCQIITFLILKSDNIENSRIKLKGIVLQVRSNQVKVTFIIILPFNLYICHFFLFRREIEGKCGWIIGGGGGGGGGKGFEGLPLKLLGSLATLPPPPFPSSYAHVLMR